MNTNYKWQTLEGFTMDEVPDLSRIQLMAEQWFSRVDPLVFNDIEYKGQEDRPLVSERRADPVPVMISIHTKRFRAIIYKEFKNIYIGQIDEYEIDEIGNMHYHPVLSSPELQYIMWLKDCPTCHEKMKSEALECE